MKTLYLHIGTPKTGSTSIQVFLCRNREILMQNGYCYPNLPIFYDRYGRARNGLFLQAMILDEKGNRDREKEERNLREGMNLLSVWFSRCDNVILSDEVIWMAVYRRRVSLWEELLEEGKKIGFQLKVVVYLRRQDQYVSSWWNQILKKRNQPLTESWEEYLQDFNENLQPDYCSALERIASVIGKENLIVRVFERGRFYKGSLEADFLHAIGLELTQDYRVSDMPANRRLEGNTHEIKRILNTLPDMTFREDDFFRDALIDFAEQSGSDYPSTVLPAAEAAEFLAPYMEGNRRIARDYFGEEDSELFDMSFSDKPKWEKDNPYMIDDVIRLAGSANRHLLRIYDEQRRELERTEKYTKKLEKRVSDLEMRRDGFWVLQRSPIEVMGMIWRSFRAYLKALRDNLS